MKDTVKDQDVKTENKNDQKKQGPSFNTNSQTKTPLKSQTTTMEDEDEDDQNHFQKEHQDKEHQHDYKTPIGTKKRFGEPQEKNEASVKTPFKSSGTGVDKTTSSNSSDKVKQK